MSLRSFSRLFTRSIYPRKINRAKVESSPGIVSQAASMLVAGRPARSLHTIRGVGAGDSTYGALVAAALTGGVGILIFKKRPDDDGPDGDVVDIKKEVDIKKDMGKHQMDVDMEAKFHMWMERMGREYPNEEEKAYRFELFKERVKEIEPFIKRGANPLPNCFGDRTDDEIRALTRCRKTRGKEYEASLMQEHQVMKKRLERALMEKAESNVTEGSKQ
ncbi:unnamed protein product [Urochloa humidicola]